MKITVTQGHMNVGVPHRCASCPVAVAICEQFAWPVTPSQQVVRVFRATITIAGVKYVTPGNVKAWLDGYDWGAAGPRSTSVLADVPFAIGPFPSGSPRRTGDNGQEHLRSAGDAHHGAAQAPREHKSDCTDREDQPTDRKAHSGPAERIESSIKSAGLEPSTTASRSSKDGR